MSFFPFVSILSARTDIDNVKHPFLLDPVYPQRLFQFLRRFQHILLRQDPGAPVHAQRLLAAGVFEDVDGVAGVGVHRRHDPARHVGTDWDEAEGEGPAEGADRGECRAGRERRGPFGVFGGPVVVVVAVGETGHGAVARVAGEVDGYWGCVTSGGGGGV